MKRRLVGFLLAVFITVQMVVTSMFPSIAYAATYAPVVDRDWNSTAYCVSGVSNRFDAALGLIGQWGKKIQISNEMYVKLSNESSGGAFWTLADSMVNPVVGANRMATAPEGWGLGPISTVLWLKIVGTCWAEYGSPADWMWCTSANQELIDNARRDFLKVLGGESLGGGGGGGSGGYYEYEIKVRYITSGFWTYFNDGLWNRVNNDGTVYDGAALVPPTMYVKIPAEYIDAACSKLGSQYSGANTYIVYQRTSKGGSGSVLVVFSPTALNVSTGTGRIGNLQFEYYKVAYSANKYTSVSDSSFVFSTNTLTANKFDAALANRTNYSSNIDFANPYVYEMVGVQSGGGGGGGGDNHWPEPTTPEPDPDPTNPEPDPEPPTPPEFDPPGFDPDVPQPDPTPTPVGEPTNTTAADYTPWLRAILTALNVIIDDMGEHCDHIRVAMRDYLSGLYDALSDDLQAYYDDLTDYLSDLAKWLVSHLNFDIKQPDVNVNVPGYDDSSVIGWLRRIYYKLGGTSTPKPDPITDTEDAFDWWQALLSWITNAVVGLLGEFVEDIDALLAFVRDKFPFSIPWDIAAYLALLDMQRQTPVVVFTIPEFEGAWDEYEIRIDLSAYDNAMSAVRTMVLIWWGMVLIMRTDWLLLLFDKQTGLAKGFVSRLTGISE